MTSNTNTVLVTGASGFVAGHIIARLLALGFRVRGTVRSIERAGGLHAALGLAPGDPRLSLVEADLLDDRGWGEAVAGCRHVIHTASPFPLQMPKHEDDIIRPAREGTLRVLSAAQRAGVERVVLTSSVAAVAYGKGAAPFTEADWSDVDGPLATPYIKSKTLAERDAWRFAEQHNLELVTINPGLVFGPLLDARHGTSVEVIRKLMTGEFAGIPDLAYSVVDVRDVAIAHVRVLCDPVAAGKRFIIAGRWLSIGSVVRLLRQSFPDYADKLPRFWLPNWLVRIAARFDADHRQVLPELGRDARVSHDRAAALLGWTPRSAAQSIRDTAESLIHHRIV